MLLTIQIWRLVSKDSEGDVSVADSTVLEFALRKRRTHKKKELDQDDKLIRGSNLSPQKYKTSAMLLDDATMALTQQTCVSNRVVSSTAD